MTSSIPVYGKNAASRGVDMARKSTDRLILGVVDSGFGREVEKHFLELGWEVIHAANNVEAGRIAQRRKMTALILSADRGDESGFLTCLKVRLVRPGSRIIMVGPESPELARDARLAGAAGYVSADSCVNTLAQAVLGT